MAAELPASEAPLGPFTCVADDDATAIEWQLFPAWSTRRLRSDARWQHKPAVQACLLELPPGAKHAIDEVLAGRRAGHPYIDVSVAAG